MILREFEINRNLPYPENLVDVLNRNRLEFQDEIKLPITYEQNKGIEYVLQKIGNREKEIIDMMFKEGLTLQRCGNVLGLTRERVRQILRRALESMRNVSYWNYFTIGYVEGITSGCEYDNGKEKIDLRQDISVLGLSTRAERGLRSAGVETLFQFVSFSDYYRMESCGRKTVEEVLNRQKLLSVKYHIPVLSFIDRINYSNLQDGDKRIIFDVLLAKLTDKELMSLC